jgi:acetyltransferase-like isoleucine patch superfamily enzyme
MWPARAGFRIAHLTAAGVGVLGRRLRRARWLWRLRLASWWLQAPLECDVAGDLRVGRRVRVRIEPRTENVVRIGPRCRLGDDVRIELAGGSLTLGPEVDIRPRCHLQVGGELRLSGANLVQHGCTLHCAAAVTIEDHVVLGELVTIVDSSHRGGGPSGWFLHDVDTAPVVVERYAWLAAKATVTRGVRVGSGAVVAANSVAVKDVAPGTVVSGIPAQAVGRAAEVPDNSSA